MALKKKAEPKTTQIVTPITAFGIAPPHPKQLRFLSSTTQNILFVAGQGSGKTTALCLRAILVALNPRNAGLPGAICVPTYPLATRVHTPMLLQMFEAFSHAAGYSLLRKYHRGAMIFELINGSEIWLQSYARVDRLRSLNLSWACIDEIEQDKNPFETFAVITGRVRGIGTNQIAVTTTPKGYRGVVKLFIDRVASKHPGYQILTCKSAENPFLSAETIEMWRSMYSAAWFAQECEAKILRPASTVFPEFSRQRHVTDFEMSRGIPWSIGCDWGDGWPHFVAVAHVMRDGKERDIVWWEFCDDDPPPYLQRKALTDLVRIYGDPIDLSGDRARKDWNSWARNEFGRVSVHTMKSHDEQRVWTGLQVVRQRLDPADGSPLLLFARHLLQTQSQRGIIACMEQYERERNSEGVLLDSPKKDNKWDNGVDAIRYAIVSRHGHLMQVI